MKVEKEKTKHYAYRSKWYAYAMLVPGLILLSIFVIYPFVLALIRSFINYSAYETDIRFVGLENYIQILKDARFFQSLKNVIAMTMVYALVMFVASFLFALVVKQLAPRMASITKTLIYIPCLLSGILVSVIFLFMFSNNGLINAIRVENGLERIVFNADGMFPYIIVVLPMLWGGFGYNTIVMLAGLHNIPKNYYEAAALDGAGSFQQMLHITLPNMKNYFVLIIINLITGGLQMFEFPLMMTGGGPLDSTLTPVLFMYWQKSNPTLTQSCVMAGCILIMIPIASINLLVFKLIRSEKSLDA